MQTRGRNGISIPNKKFDVPVKETVEPKKRRGVKRSATKTEVENKVENKMVCSETVESPKENIVPVKTEAELKRERDLHRLFRKRVPFRYVSPKKRNWLTPEEEHFLNGTGSLHLDLSLSEIRKKVEEDVIIKATKAVFVEPPSRKRATLAELMELRREERRVLGLDMLGNPLESSTISFVSI